MGHCHHISPLHQANFEADPCDDIFYLWLKISLFNNTQSTIIRETVSVTFKIAF